MFLSVGVRMVVNVEALNMVESVGNVTRHRKATIVFRKDGEYVVRVVPVISGESVAHAYQYWITELAKKAYPKDSVPLCEYCERGEFLKHCDSKLFGGKDWEKELKVVVEGKDYEPHQVEETIVKNCIVEDIGGFLYPGARPVKRTSRFQVGYVVPTMDTIEKGAVAVEPQFHVRYSLSQAQQQGQMIYYVETGSAVYSMTFNLDIDGIGVTSMVKVVDVVGEQERKKRVELAIDALAVMLDSKIFGAKLSRFTPVTDYETVLAVVSDYPPLVVSPPAVKEFVEKTVARSKKYGEAFGTKAKLFGYGEGLPKEVEKADNLIELFEKVKEAVKAGLR